MITEDAHVSRRLYERVIQNDMAGIHGFIALVYTVTAQCLAIAWTGEWPCPVVPEHMAWLLAPDHAISP